MALREITDPDGTKWQVYDVQPKARPRLVPGELQGGWLVFESATEKCRIAPIPEEWETSPEETLVALLSEATHDLKRKLPGEQ